MMIHIAGMLLVYICILIYFSKRWKKPSGDFMYYTFNGDQTMFLEDNAIFKREYTRELKNLKTNQEKCEWTLERIRNTFQNFAYSDSTLWPYQSVVSILASIIIMMYLSVKLSFTSVITTSFVFFVLMDLPRRFYAFHKNALLSNKLLNLYLHYYKIRTN